MEEILMSEIENLFKRHLEQRNRPITLYGPSLIQEGSDVLFLIRERRERKIVIVHPRSATERLCKYFVSDEIGQLEVRGTIYQYCICPCSHDNASSLRELFPFTRPRPIGLAPAIGTGDRIGLATPGHIRALRRYRIAPVLAQQSVREMTRTARSPQEVMDDVLWAVFQEGYREGFGADADHLKTPKDIEDTYEAGFTMYTIDPSDYVDDTVDECSPRTVEERFEKLPWDELKSTKDEFLRMYLDREFEFSDGNRALKLEFSKEELLRAAIKYSFAIVHTAKLWSHLQRLFNGKPFDLEVSFDETEKQTSLLEHLLIASELKRLNVQFHSLAIHLPGKFEKAIDYVGDLKEFESALRGHMIICRNCGPYKLSIHSGSDKFSIYGIVGRLAPDLFHLKTAGTSYLEALRIVTMHDPTLLREIVRYAMRCYEKDRQTYRLSTELRSIPNVDGVKDEDLEATYLKGDSGRQLLHVTFGSILTARDENGGWLFRGRIRDALLDNEEEFYQNTAKHFERHLSSLGVKPRTS
jgi:hypothetical protein